MKNEERGKKKMKKKRGRRTRPARTTPALARLLLLELKVVGAPLTFGRPRSWSLGFEVLPF